MVTHTIDGKEEKCLKLVLSKTDRHKMKNESPQDIGDIPKVGDDLVQIGNRDNKERQSVILTSSLKKHIFYNWLINNILYLYVT